MPRLYDSKGSPVDVPSDQLVGALSTGKYGIRPGNKIGLVAPDGEVFLTDQPADILKAKAEGWKIETDEQRRAYELEKEYGGLGGEALAALAGVGRGLTFGGFDVALTGLGIAESETLAGLKAANPWASGIGEMGAIAGSMLVPGGQARGLGLLRGLTAAPKAVTKLGVGAERLAGRALGGAAGKGVIGRTAGRGIELGAGSALEGALYGGGVAVSEAALGNLDLTAENLLGHVGMGAAIGGVFGVGLGSGFQGMKELVTGTGKLTKAGAASFVKMWEKRTGNKAVPGLADTYADIAGTATGRVDDIKALMTKEGRKAATQPLEVRDTTAVKLADKEDVMEAAYDNVFEHTTGRRKKETFLEISEAQDLPAPALVPGPFDEVAGLGLGDDLPDGWWVHGRSAGDNLDTGYVVQATRDWDVARQYSGRREDGIWLLKPKKDAVVMDMTDPKVIDRIERDLVDDWENGKLSQEIEDILEFQKDAGAENPARTLAEEFAPDDIVNTAGAHDNPDAVEWLAEKYRLGVAETAEGMIVYDVDAVHKGVLGKMGKPPARGGGGLAAEKTADDLLGSGVPIVRDDAGAIIQGGGLISELDEAVALASRAEGELGYIGHWKDLRVAAARTRKEIDKARGKADYTGRVFGALDDFKREVGRIRYKKMPKVRNKTGKDLRAIDRADALYKRIQGPLEDANIWGKKAAETQRKYNQRWVAYLEDIQRRPKHAFSEAFSTTDGKIKVQARPDGFRGYIDDMGSPSNALDEPWLTKQMETRQELMDEAVALYSLPEEVIRKVDKARAELAAFRKLHDETKNIVGKQNQLRSLDEAARNTGFTAEMGFLGGAILGGPVGAVAGGVIGAVMNPARTIRQLVTLERISGGYSQRVKAGLHRFIDRYRPGASTGKRGKLAKRLIAPTSVHALKDASFGEKKRESKTRQEAFQHRMEELREFTAPEISASRIAKSTETVGHVAPKVAQAIQVKALQAAKFLLAKAPKNPGAPIIFGPEWKPSETALSTFERYVRAVSDPMSIVTDLENGTLSHEAVEAMKAIYPKMYEEIRSEMIANIGELRETLPYSERIQLSILFDMPVDPTMQPEFIAIVQAHQIRISPEMMAQPKARKANERFDPAEHMTTAQRLEAKG